MKSTLPDDQLDKTFVEFHPDSWKQAQDIGMQLSGWAYRGHCCSEWKFETSLERTHKRISPANSIKQCEKSVLDRFMRRAHHFISYPPDQHNALEWLSLIQHYGGPTRLLDFTKSFYIAAFFALEKADSDAAVWCLNINLLRETSKQLLSSIGKENFEPDQICNRIIRDEIDIPAVIDIEPYRLNERLIVQQGLFVMPCSLSENIETCLFGTISNESLLVERSKYDLAHLQLGTFPIAGKVLKIVLPKGIHADVRKGLCSMNIDAASLFPGLDGFARSLNSHL